MRSSARFPVIAPVAAADVPDEDEVGAAVPLTWREGVEVVVAITEGGLCAVLVFAGKCRW